MTPVRQTFLVAISIAGGVSLKKPMEKGEVRTMRWCLKHGFAKLTKARNVIVTPKGEKFLREAFLPPEKMVYNYIGQNRKVS
jgi:hypothetical protein